MLKNRKNVGNTRKQKAYLKSIHVEAEDEERFDKPKNSSKAEVDEKRNEGSHIEERLPSQPCAENGNNDGGDDATTVKHPPLVKVSSKAKVPTQDPPEKSTGNINKFCA
ncbi:dnaJ domain-containing protein [Artemisia annua]|uniref:DnaJ domain-containing protein n=1 Tax=Artemisia annua TaxID=35608 RepID=A0A2U1LYK7_ARTAN|nr:dnaJ domain-containing protein [Artemisia annua]